MVGLLLALQLSMLIGFSVQGEPLRVPFLNTPHLLLEVICVIVAAGIFAIGWSSRFVRTLQPFIVLACGFLGVAVLDLAHALSMPGMPDYFSPNTRAKTIAFWFAARYLAAFTLLLAVGLAIKHREMPTRLLWPWRYVSLLAVLFYVALAHYVGLVSMEGAAGVWLGQARYGLEGGVVLLQLICVALMLGKFQRTPLFHPKALFSAVCIMTMSDAFFLVYRQADDIYSALGHVYKVIGFLLLFRAVFIEVLRAPHELLNATASRLQAVLNAVPDTLFEVDEHGNVTALHTLRQTPLFPQAPLGKPLRDFLSEPMLTVCEEVFDEVRHKGYSQGRQIVVQHNQQHWTFELSVTARSQGHDLASFLVLARDVSGRIKRDDELRKLQLAVDQSPNTIMITDLNSRLIYVNKAFETNTGYTLEEAMGRSPRLLHSGKTPLSTYRDLWEHLSQGKPWWGEFINRRKDGSEYIESVQVSPVLDETGQTTSYLAIKEDITERRADQQRLNELVNFDPLTGLPNRSLLSAQLDKLAQESQEHPNGQFALLYIGLDGFKYVNDSLGYPSGDLLLREMAERLIENLRADCIIGRHSGDEFLVLFPAANVKKAALLAERLQEVIGAPVTLNDLELVTTASIGIAIYPDDGRESAELIRCGAIAMHEAKQAGRGLFRFFSPEMQARSSRVLQLENALRTALAREELSVFYQPQVSVSTGEVVGAEALLRWHHPEMGFVRPDEFIQVAEASGLIIQIGEWVLHTAMEQAKAWLEQGHPQFVLAVNLSLAQFNHPGMLSMLDNALATTGFPARNLELELTESITMNDPDGAAEIITAMGERGVLLSIDDFGTGYSSLSYLKRLDVHKLKIDTSFIRDIHQDETNRSIVLAILSMAKSMGMVTTAEGVETEDELAVLRELDCEEAQGYLFSRPVPVEVMTAWLSSQPARRSD